MERNDIELENLDSKAVNVSSKLKEFSSSLLSWLPSFLGGVANTAAQEINNNQEEAAGRGDMSGDDIWARLDGSLHELRLAITSSPGEDWGPMLGELRAFADTIDDTVRSHVVRCSKELDRPLGDGTSSADTTAAHQYQSQPGLIGSSSSSSSTTTTTNIPPRTPPGPSWPSNTPRGAVRFGLRDQTPESPLASRGTLTA